MSLHWSFPRGTKIRIILKDGRQVITKFLRKTEQGRIITEAGEFRKQSVRSCNYYKPLPHEMTP